LTLAENRKVADRLAMSPDGPDVIDVRGGAAAAGVDESRIAAVARAAARKRHAVTNVDRIAPHPSRQSQDRASPGRN